MMSTAEKQQKLSESEYLERERASDYKSEFYRSEMFAMVGATRAHNLITLNSATTLNVQLKDRTCEVYANDMRVKVAASGLYTYPDVVIVCDEPQFEDDVLDTLLNPKVIIEVLSESTEAYDRGMKFSHYRKIPSLQEYFLISQSEPVVDKFMRQTENQWVLTEYRGMEAVVPVTSAVCRLPLNEVYDKVQFEEGDDSTRRMS